MENSRLSERLFSCGMGNSCVLIVIGAGDVHENPDAIVIANEYIKIDSVSDAKGEPKKNYPYYLEENPPDPTTQGKRWQK